MGLYLILQINQLIETILKGPCSNMGNNHTKIEKNSDAEFQDVIQLKTARIFSKIKVAC